ncbi:MAG: Do family serine endopeptidase AlgW [Gammaproteobacteria bacterium]|nr:MAG: Do family serine endopeptidase AlgW [Gammaproteobacteria bacterium]
MRWQQSLIYKSFTYISKAIVLGLALAFVITLIWPQAKDGRDPKMVIRQVAMPAASAGNGVRSYADAVERAAPSVVNINTSKVVTIRPHPFFDDPIFRQFFGQDLNALIKPKKQIQNSLGSGVIVNKNGFVLTNYHVIREADSIQVALRDGRTTAARVIGVDPETDLAVLRIELDNLPAITLGHSGTLRVGDVVLTIGNPFGVGQTVTMGIVSATGRNKLGINTFENFIQTDAAINPGNSGGALVDANGNLIGINTAIFSKSGGSQGIGFAIPTKLAVNVLDEIIRYGRPRRGWLGIEADPVTEELARTLGMKEPRGIIIVGVLRNGPAHKAGIEPGDVIINIEGTEITDAQSALFAISSKKPGEQLKLKIYRDGKKLDLVATVIERPQQRPDGRK